MSHSVYTLTEVEYYLSKSREFRLRAQEGLYLSERLTIQELFVLVIHSSHIPGKTYS